MTGFSQKTNKVAPPERQKYSRYIVPIVFILLMLVTITSLLIGYYIGRTNDIGLYRGQIIDTIIVSPGQAGRDVKTRYQVNIRGQVRYTDGTPFAYGTIELRSEPRYTTTDSQGFFSFDNVGEGVHTITVLQEGRVLARSTITAERSSLIGNAQVVRLNDGSYSVLLPLEVTVVDLVLELKKEGDNHTLVVSLDPIQRPPDGANKGEFPGRNDIPPGEEPGEDDTPGEGDLPGEGEIPGGDVPGGNIPGGGEIPGETPGGGGIPGGGEVPTGKPKFNVSGENVTSQPWTQTTSVDIFAERPGNSGVKTIDGKNVIAPGSYGKYIFKLKNPEVYPLAYKIDLSELDQNTPRLAMRYRLRHGISGDYVGGNSWKTAVETKELESLLAANKEKYYTLEWKWLTINDATDTAIGRQGGSPVYILDIKINAWFK